MPELRQLRAFVAVAHELSFTRAAESLNVTQQTVSKTIRDLEKELGVELLERTTREVHLTDAGVSLLEPARETLRQVDAAFETTRAVGAGTLGTVRIGTTPAIGSGDTTDIARALRAEAGEIAVSFREVRPGDLSRALRAREIDLALARASADGDTSLHRADLRPTAAAVFVASGHRLAGQASVSLEQFDGERLLAASAEGTPYTDLLVRRLAEAGATVTVVESRVTGGAGSMLTELERASAIAIKPASTDPPAGVVRLNVEGLTLPLVLLWPAGLPSKAALWLRRSLRARDES